MKRLSILLLCVILMLSLTSCVEEESPESLEMPEDSSIVTYTISDTESIRLLYNDYFTGYGEWIKDGEIIKIHYLIDYDYWGFFASREGIAEIRIELYRIDGVTVRLDPYTNELTPSALGLGLYPDNLIGRLDEGMLNSTSITYYDHDAGGYEAEPSVSISNIAVEHTEMIMFDWAPEEWRQFVQNAKDGFLKLDEADLWYSYAEGRGEWITSGVAIPIRIELIEYAPAMIIYDISGEEEKIILFGRGTTEDEFTLILDEMNTSMFYGDTVSSVTVRVVASIEPPETEAPITESIPGTEETSTAEPSTGI